MNVTNLANTFNLVSHLSYFFTFILSPLDSNILIYFMLVTIISQYG